MCFSLPASLVAGSLGVGFGYAMNNAIGIFVMYFSLVQFAEGAVYAGCHTAFWDRALVILLGSQLTVYTLATQKATSPAHYPYMSAFGILVFAYSVVSPLKQRTSESCVEYLYNDRMAQLLFLQYLSILYSTVSQPEYRCTGYTLAVTGFLSYFCRNYANASLWCWSSAVAAPLMWKLCA